MEIVGDFLALAWEDGDEVILPAHTLRKNSPSAEQAGESDIFGRIRGGSNQKDFQQVRLLSAHKVGNYAVRLVFSDGHGSGIYSWEYLRHLSVQQN
jgi:DUF971 family protein